MDGALMLHFLHIIGAAGVGLIVVIAVCEFDDWVAK
jgi:hypothetical protein